jgi:hypothetical protein
MLEKPDWTYWRNLVAVELRQAVILSFDISPDALPRAGRDLEQVTANSLVDRRLRVAESHLANGQFKPYSSENGHITVILGAFRTWAESLSAPFLLPDEFPSDPSEHDASRTAQVISDIPLPTELQAAVDAFRAVFANSAATRGTSPKIALRRWLDANRSSLSLNARERIATVANWQPIGGAPKTVSSRPTKRQEHSRE